MTHKEISLSLKDQSSLSLAIFNSIYHKQQKIAIPYSENTELTTFSAISSAA